MTITFSDGTAYEDETNFLLGIPETPPTASITVTPQTQTAQAQGPAPADVSNDWGAVQGAPGMTREGIERSLDEMTNPGRAGSSLRVLPDAVTPEVQDYIDNLPEGTEAYRDEDGTVHIRRKPGAEPLISQAPLSERLMSQTLIPSSGTSDVTNVQAQIESPGMFVAQTDRRPFLEQVFTPPDLGTAMEIATNFLGPRVRIARPNQGPIERSGVNMYQRELRRDPVEGRFNQQPEEFGGRQGVPDHLTQRMNRFPNEQIPFPYTREEWHSMPRSERNDILSTQPPLEEGIPAFLRREPEPKKEFELTPAEQRAEKAREVKAGRRSGPTESIPFQSKEGAAGEITVYPTNSGKNVHVEWIGDPWASAMDDSIARPTGPVLGPNDLGAAEIKRLLKEVQKRFPDAETMTGYRISGARANTGDGPMDAFINLPKRKK